MSGIQLQKFKKSAWRSMKIIAEPTTTAGQIREDEDGKRWEWSGGLKYVYAKPVAPSCVHGIALRAFCCFCEHRSGKQEHDEIMEAVGFPNEE